MSIIGKYEILERKTFSHFINKLAGEHDNHLTDGLPFKKINVIIKNWRKDKTPKQHRFYFAIIGKIVKKLKEDGIETNREQLHECFKTRIDYVDQVMLHNGEVLFFTRSIKDNSDDVNIKIMNELIDYVLRWAIENIELYIEDER